MNDKVPASTIAWRVGITARCDKHVLVDDPIAAMRCDACVEKQTLRAKAEWRRIREAEENDGA